MKFQDYGRAMGKKAKNGKSHEGETLPEYFRAAAFSTAAVPKGQYECELNRFVSACLDRWKQDFYGLNRAISYIKNQAEKLRQNPEKGLVLRIEAVPESSDHLALAS